MFVAPGLACIKQAAREEISGVESDVPLVAPTVPLGKIMEVPEPCATTSGLMRLSAVGPMEEKLLYWLVLVTLPTHITESPSAGGAIFGESGNVKFPLLPAEFTTKIPF